MTSIFALTTRGLETVSAGEISELSGVTVEQIGYRRVAAECSASLAPLLALRTVDDVFVDVGTWQGIGRHRSVLAELQAMSGQLNLRRATAVCAGMRPVHRPPVFSVTASFVGKRNYSAEEMKQACAEGIAASYSGWTYTADDRDADLNMRLFVEHETAYAGIRLSRAPLQSRLYKRAHVPGSLKPPVAAALLEMAGVTPRSRLLDPCCGAGTILIEGALSGAEAQGGDSDPAAVAAARTNADVAGVPARVRLWDAGRLPLADSSIDRVVTNLPWGRKVSAESDLAALYDQIGTEVRRVLAPGGCAAVLTNAPHLVDSWGLRREKQVEISLFGQTPTILVLAQE